MAAVQQVVAWLRGRRGAVFGLALLWVAVTAAGAGRRADRSSWLGMPPLDWLTYVLLVFMVIGAVVIVAAVIVAPKQELQPRGKRRPMWPLLLLALVFLILSQREPGPRGEGTDFTVPPAEEEEAVDGPGIGGGQIDRNQLAFLALMLGAAVAVLALSRRRPEPEPLEFEPETMEQALSPAVDRATEHLLLGGDPRSAVLMAYDNLESALTDLGQSRELSETASEHLRRVLIDLPIDTAPLLQLADLYQLARFSTHPITADDQRRAATSLQRAQAELAAVT